MTDDDLRNLAVEARLVLMERRVLQGQGRTFGDVRLPLDPEFITYHGLAGAHYGPTRKLWVRCERLIGGHWMPATHLAAIVWPTGEWLDARLINLIRDGEPNDS